ncbi:unnamed protein product [Musa textilis]
MNREQPEDCIPFGFTFALLSLFCESHGLRPVAALRAASAIARPSSSGSPPPSCPTPALSGTTCGTSSSRKACWCYDDDRSSAAATATVRDQGDVITACHCGCGLPVAGLVPPECLVGQGPFPHTEHSSDSAYGGGIDDGTCSCPNAAPPPMHHEAKGVELLLGVEAMVAEAVNVLIGNFGKRRVGEARVLRPLALRRRPYLVGRRRRQRWQQ